MQGLLIDQFGGLVRCEFEARNYNENRNVLVMMPGEPVVSLKEYREKEDLEDAQFRLLSANGETLSSTAIGMMLSTTMAFDTCYMKERLNHYLNWLKIMHLDWGFESLNLGFVIKKVKDKYDLYDYSLFIRNVDLGAPISEKIDDFRSVDDVMEYIRAYVLALEDCAFIPVESKHLFTSKEVGCEMTTDDENYFDKIKTY